MLGRSMAVMWAECQNINHRIWPIFGARAGNRPCCTTLAHFRLVAFPLYPASPVGQAIISNNIGTSAELQDLSGQSGTFQCVQSSHRVPTCRLGKKEKKRENEKKRTRVGPAYGC